MLVKLKAYRWFIAGILAVLVGLGGAVQLGLISANFGGEAATCLYCTSVDPSANTVLPSVLVDAEGGAAGKGERVTGRLSSRGLVEKESLIDCGTRCTYKQSTSFDMLLTAYPATGQHIAGWNGDPTCGTSNTCAVRVDANKTVAPVFEWNYLKVTSTDSVRVRSSEGAWDYVTEFGRSYSVWRTYIDCGASVTTCLKVIDSGTTPTFHLRALYTGTVFDGWTGACTNTTGDCVVAIDGPKVVGVKVNPVPTPTP